MSHAGAMADVGALHHIELRTGNLPAASASWGWLLGELGYELHQQWSDGRSWALGPTYLVLESAPRPGTHDRRSPGLSHLAFHAGERSDVDRLWSAASDHGWSPLYADRWPWAGGPEHYAAFLEDEERFKVELVASAPRR
jgi:catechol-2,3-dioxygenase